MAEPVADALVVHLQDVAIYQQQNLVLRDVNLKISEGEFLYIIGKTGTGKSSLLKTLYGDLPLKDGHAIVTGFDLSKLTWKKLPALRRKMGIVFQDFNLLNDRTVSENLKFVLRATGWKDKAKMDVRVDTVLDKVGLKTKGFKKPHELSGGEQQRVVIARALLNNPELLLADEPTGNLDPDTSYDIIKLLRQINKDLGTTVIIATHDYRIIEQFPARIIQCENGLLNERQKSITE